MNLGGHVAASVKTEKDKFRLRVCSNLLLHVRNKLDCTVKWRTDGSNSTGVKFL